MSKSKQFVHSSDDSGSDEEPKKKIQKKEKGGEHKASASSSKNSQKSKASNDSGENKYEIGRMRYVSVSEFRGKKMVSIREYYTADDGEERPGKKGISLTLEQWQKLKAKIKDVDRDLASDDD